MNKERIMIYFFFDEKGIIDEYIFYFLKKIKKYISKIIFVSNGDLENIGKSRLKNEIENLEILERENKGFDVWAYKEGIEYVGWDSIIDYYELILANYTIFGPIYDFSEMFDFMDKKNIDFWGITKHHKVNFDAFGTCKYGYIPEHIQSSFISIRNSMLKSKLYKMFWDNMPMINSYADSVGLYEAIFTKDFTDLGFKHEVYINTEDLREYTRYPLMMMSDELVINRKCPVIKRKSFSQSYYDILSESIGSATLNLYNYLKEKTNYDVNLIWHNILRTFHMSDIKDIMHLNYILPTKVKINDSTEIDFKKKVALVLHIFFEDKIEDIFKYAINIPENVDVFITTDNIEKKKKIESIFKNLICRKLTIIIVENRGRDVSALIVGFKDFVFDYDYVCFAHDKKTSQLKPLCIGEGFSYKCFENVLGSKEYILNIIDLFNNNEKLGLLTPPPPNHSSFYQTIYSAWSNNYNNTCELLEKMKINVPIHWSKEPIAPLGTMFWFRTKALRKLFEQNWKYDDFPQEPNDMDGTILHAIERAYPYFVQNEGYYSAWMMTDEFSRIELSNLYFMLRLSVKSNSNNNMSTSANQDMIRNMKFLSILKIKLKKYFSPRFWNFMKTIYYKLNFKN